MLKIPPPVANPVSATIPTEYRTIAAALISVGLEHLVGTFVKEEMTLEVAADVDDATLRSEPFNMTVGAVKKLRTAIAQMQVRTANLGFATVSMRDLSLIFSLSLWLSNRHCSQRRSRRRSQAR